MFLQYTDYAHLDNICRMGKHNSPLALGSHRADDGKQWTGSPVVIMGGFFVGLIFVILGVTALLDIQLFSAGASVEGFDPNEIGIVVVGLGIWVGIGGYWKLSAPHREIKRLQKRAQRGDPEAQYQLAHMLQEGFGTLDRNPKLAEALFGSAAEKGIGSVPDSEQTEATTTSSEALQPVGKASSCIWLILFIGPHLRWGDVRGGTQMDPIITSTESGLGFFVFIIVLMSALIFSGMIKKPEEGK